MKQQYLTTVDKIRGQLLCGVIVKDTGQLIVLLLINVCLMSECGECRMQILNVLFFFCGRGHAALPAGES